MKRVFANRHFILSVVHRLGLCFAILLSLSLGATGTVCAAVVSEFADTAETFDFAVNGANLPISATTKFFNPGANPDLDNTAQHEIGHGLGFTVVYTLFNANVSLLGAGPNRQYKDGDDATVLAQLTPEASGTHMLTGVTVDGNNQTNDIMRADQVVGQNWGAQDTKILQDAFDWQDKDITVTIVFQGPWTNLQKTTITTAASTVSGALGTGAAAHAFTWTVVSVPEPGAGILSMVGMFVLLRRRMRR